ncbi:MAG: hypothetical protein KUG77_17850 [Nannocystaceae bacterium]|nr:hypothetical protein [Nannocystaceae bacterium]
MTNVDNTYSMTNVGSVVVAVHTHGSAQGTVDGICAAVEGLSQTRAEGVAVFLVLHSGAKPPDTESRTKLVELMRSRRSAVVTFAVVMLGTGFWAAAARSVLTFMSLASGLPVKVFCEADDAHAWVIEKLPNVGDLDEAALRRAVREGVRVSHSRTG